MKKIEFAKINKSNIIIYLAIIILVIGLGISLWSRFGENSEQKQVNNQMGQSVSKSCDYLFENKSTNNITNNKNMQWTKEPEMQIDVNKSYCAKIETSEGSVTVELFAKENPITVNNFIFLAKQGFYNGTKFHRIIKNFMIQGGDPQGTGMGGPGYKFNDEPITRNYDRGMIAMANSGKNTNGSQFFIMHANNPLPKNYVIFGKVVDGLDTLDKLANVPVTYNQFGEASQPISDVILKAVLIEEDKITTAK